MLFSGVGRVFVPMHRMTHRNVRVMGGCGVVAMLRVLGRRSMMRGRFLEVLRGCMSSFINYLSRSLILMTAGR